VTQPTGAPPWGSPDPSGPAGAPRAPSAGEAPDRAPAGPLFEVRDPATEDVIERVPAATAEDADAAVERAAAAFEGWRAVAPADRARLLRRLAERLDAERERLAQLEMRNAGKPIGDARGELGMVVDTFAYYAGAPERLLGDTIPVAGGVDLTFREPLGVVGLIVPWNFPLMLASWKLAPALAAGNTVVLKPAGLTPLTALAFAELASEAGIPPGVVNVLPGPGRLVGRRLVEHPKVAKVAFTGSTEVGREVMRGAAGTIKRVTLELGGKSANVVFADADLPAAAAAAPPAVFGNAGQDCCARSRILVERSAMEEFLALLEPAVTGLRVGDPADERTQMGPLISAGQREAVASFVPEGTPVAIRGSAPAGPGHWYPPTVLTGLAPGDRAVTEEIFGPVVVVLPFADEAEAVRLANATIYGLSGSIWTRDVGRALRVARAVETGTLSVNSNTSVRVATPFGGFKQSGVGRELGPHALDHYTEVKNVFLAT
jgi:acyl-CoA reductase-like NAD-dependent aldehyde dehydrogenase